MKRVYFFNLGGGGVQVRQGGRNLFSDREALWRGSMRKDG